MAIITERLIAMRTPSRTFKYPIQINLLIVPFLLAWAIYVTFLVVFFFDSIRGGLLLALMCQGLFVAIVAIPNTVDKNVFRSPLNSIQRLDLFFLIALTFISTAALSALFYDRTLQHIDYSNGVCGARYQMSAIGETRKGISSIYSFFGLLFGFFYFAALPIAFMRRISRPLFWTIICISCGFLIAQSALTASRFPALLYILVLVALAAIRLSRAPMPKIRVSDVLFTLIITGLAVGFIMGQFSCRANLSHLNGEAYAESFVQHLLIPPSTINATPSPSLPPFLRDVFGLLKITAYYGVHSAFSFGAIVDLDARPGNISLSGPIFLLSKIGINFTTQPISPAVAGRFVSLPGSFYYDVGLVGLVIISILISATIFFVKYISDKFPNSICMYSILVCLLIVLYISPVTFAVSIMHFPFIAFAMISSGAVLDLMRHFSRKEAMHEEDNASTETKT